MGQYKNIRNNQEGAVLPLVGLALSALILAAGFTIDYTRAQIVQERLQWAVDAATLAGAHAGKSGDTNAVREAATRYFNANFPAGYMGVNGRPALSVRSIGADKGSFGSAAKGWEVKVDNVKVPTWIIGYAGMNEIKVSGLAQVNTAPLTPLDIVMSFDLSGSMDVTAGKGCMFLPYYGHCFTGTPKITEAKNAMKSLVDRLNGKSTRFGLIGWDVGVRKRQGLTNASNIKSAINGMSTGGNTDGALGMREAKDMIVPSNATNRALIFLTDGINTAYYGHGSDCCAGENSAAANQKTRELCQSAKNNGVSVYTIVYDLKEEFFPDAGNKQYVRNAKSMLQYCASSNICNSEGRRDRNDGLCYFDASNVSELNAAMTEIGNSMMTVRLTK